MINHIQTLLLNESASTVLRELSVAAYGYIDPSYVQVPVNQPAWAAYYGLFSEESDISTRLSMATKLADSLSSPELADLVSRFDTRRIPPADPIVLDTELPVSIVSVEGVSSVFYPTGVGVMDEIAAKAKKLFDSSPETTKKLSAVVLSLSAHLEAARLKQLSANI